MGDDQERDDHGRFAGSGGGASSLGKFAAAHSRNDDSDYDADTMKRDSLGYSAQRATHDANKSGSAADHSSAADAHMAAANAFSKADMPTRANFHMKAAERHTQAAAAETNHDTAASDGERTAATAKAKGASEKASDAYDKVTAEEFNKNRASEATVRDAYKAHVSAKIAHGYAADMYPKASKEAVYHRRRENTHGEIANGISKR